ncbi:MgtC/SapB family protein, partial [Candidatus Woesearchaeota archaeon]|nr:MgtC/SapB family protein [Candidatus Woesearchaeota archaeon]
MEIGVTLIQNFAIALALGLLIGLEREYARYQKRGHDYGGIRTYPLIALFGALAAFISDLYSPFVLLGGILMIGVLIIVAYFQMSATERKFTGVTSEVAGFLTFFIGILAYYGEFTLAIVLAVVITILLYLRSFLHHFAEKLNPGEMSDTLKFAVVAFVILPFLPDRGFGPHGIFNPYVTWLMVVFISGIGFVGYIFMKWFGEKGVMLAGILGGLISSTATTSSFALRSKKENKNYLPLVMGVVLANGIMFMRILIEVFVINQELFWYVLIPMSVLAVIT